MSEKSFIDRLEQALTVAIVELEDLKRLGFLTRYDKQPFMEEGVYHLTAYAKDPNKVDRLLGNLSARLSLKFDLPFSILVSRDVDDRAKGVTMELPIAVEEGIKLAERLNQERLGGQGKILGVHKSVEGGDYVIWMEVPLEIYEDLDLTTEIGVEVLKLSDRLGVPFFLYIVPPGYWLTE